MIEDFLNAAMTLKAVPRQGWINKLGIKNPESVADHCYSMAVMAMLFSDMKKLDTGKIIQMTLLHDLAESITGDLTPEDAAKPKKEKLEDAAMKKILSSLPKPLRTKYGALWAEYLQNDTKEAKLLHQIDKLEMSLQAERYKKDGYTKKQLEPFFDSAKKQITDPQLKKLCKTYK